MSKLIKNKTSCPIIGNNQCYLKVAKSSAMDCLNLVRSLIVALDAKGNIVFINKKGYRQLGYKFGSLNGKNWFETVISPGERNVVRRVFGNCMKGKIKLTENFQNNVLDSRGRLLKISWFNSLIKDERGKIIGTLSSGEDITAQARAHQELEKSEKKYHAIMEHSTEAVLIMDLSGRIDEVNHQAAILSGYSVKELKRMSFFSLIDLNFRQIFRQRLLAYFNDRKESKKDFILTTDFYSKEGNKVMVEGVIKTITFNSSRIAVAVLRDVSEKGALDKMKTEFVSVASHQMRTPLTAIRWFLEELYNEELGPLNEQQKDYLSEIIDSNNRMVKLVNDLLNVSRLEAGRVNISPEPTDIVKLIIQVMGDYSPYAKAKNCGVRFLKPAEPLPKINIDPTLVKEVLNNLVSNAIKYSFGKKGACKVTVKINKRYSDLLISVNDTGLGIPTKDQYKVFQKFFRSDNALKVETEGSGLGLYIAKIIIEYCGGKMWFKSAENKGSSFIFSLPLAGSKRQKGMLSIMPSRIS